MQIARKNFGAIQNLGWFDRSLRALVGAALISVVFFDLYSGRSLGWHAYLPIIAIYPFITAIVGWDPLYAMGHVKSCDTSKRNQCGTFPYEVEAAAGKDVHCRDGYDCSVPGSESDSQPGSRKA